MRNGPLRNLDRAERAAWLRLIRSENVGPVTFRHLLRRYGTATKALGALPDLARRGGRRRPVVIPPAAEIAAELDAIDSLGARAIALCEPEYPPSLRAIEDAPPLLLCLGHAHLLRKPAVAIVGARNASANGRRLAERIASDLAARGLVVVSGLARGIDAAAHGGALEGGTVAVMAGGLDVVYPEENAGLYREIDERGAIVGEMPPGTVPQARHFPRRNRLVSGLALGTLVVEAAPRSGSLITARLALEQGREVMAVPGSPLDPRARGCNDLLRQGATLVESAADVIEALSGPLRSSVEEPEGAEFPDAAPRTPADQELEPAREAVAELLGPTAVAVDEVIRRCQVSAPLVQTVLLELELAGRLERHPGGRVALIADPDT